MKMRAWYLPAVLLTLLAAGFTPTARADKGDLRVLIAEFKNTSRDTHATYAPTATDAVAVELMKRKLYDVVPRSEMNRVAKDLGVHAPYREEDLARIAREVGAAMIVSGEIASVDLHVRDNNKGVEVGLIVRVKDVELGELINGAAVKAFSSESADGQKTEGGQALDAISGAALRAVQRMAAYQPITGTILNNGNIRGMVLNRGSGHGVKRRQEFIIFRNNTPVGRARVTSVSPSYSELIVVDNTLGIQGQDRALAVFPEPKFSDK